MSASTMPSASARANPSAVNTTVLRRATTITSGNSAPATSRSKKERCSCPQSAENATTATTTTAIAYWTPRETLARWRRVRGTGGSGGVRRGEPLPEQLVVLPARPRVGDGAVDGLLQRRVALLHRVAVLLAGVELGGDGEAGVLGGEVQQRRVVVDRRVDLAGLHGGALQPAA